MATGTEKDNDSPVQEEKAKLVVDYGLNSNAVKATKLQDIGAPQKGSMLKGILLGAVLIVLIYAGYKSFTSRFSPTPQDTVQIEIAEPDQTPVEEIIERPDLAHLRSKTRYQVLHDKYLQKWTEPVLDASDTVAMESGKMLTGKIISITDASVTVKTIKETVECPLSEMKYYSKIKFSAKEYADYMTLKMLEHEAKSDIN